MEYRYGMRLRGFSPMCQPTDGLVDISPEKVKKNGRTYWNVLTYDRKLSKKELEDYELDFIGKVFLCESCGYEGSNCPYPQEEHCEKYVKKEA